MKCIIPGTNCKILARAIHALAKIGDEMWVQPKEKSLSFRSVDVSNSAFCDFTFHDNYFSSYTFDDSEDEDAVKCKISMRSAMTVFKSPVLIDKLVETCHIRLEPNADKFIFVFKFRNSVIKTFLLPIVDCETLQVTYAKDNVPNKLSMRSRILTDAVQNFQQNLTEVTMEVTPQKLSMRNYIDETSGAENETRTQLALAVGEFDDYNVGLEARITFCMKELRALLVFAESVGLLVGISFESAGKPIVFDLKNPAFEANLVLSTQNPDGSENSVSMAHSIRQSARKRAAPKKQSGKSSSKRATNSKTTVSNKSVHTRSFISTITTETNRSKNSTPMETDRDDSSLADRNGLNNSDLPPLVYKNPTPGTSKEEIANRRSNFIQVSSPSRASCSSNGISDPKNLGVSSNRETEPSIFSPGWKRKSDNIIEEEVTDLPMEEDVIPKSPPRPAKKTKMMFRKCFEKTFDPRMLPGYDTILAEDSDEEN